MVWPHGHWVICIDDVGDDDDDWRRVVERRGWIAGRRGLEDCWNCNANDAPSSTFTDGSLGVVVARIHIDSNRVYRLTVASIREIVYPFDRPQDDWLIITVDSPARLLHSYIVQFLHTFNVKQTPCFLCNNARECDGPIIKINSVIILNAGNRSHST